MPVFYFDLKVHNGYKHRMRVELDTPRDVPIEAVRFTGEMIRDMDRDLDTPTATFDLLVTDEEERPVYEVRFTGRNHLVEEGASTVTS